MNSSAKERVAMVPLEKELKEAHRKRQVLDQLLGMRGGVERLARGGMDGAKFAAYDAFLKAINAAIGVVKNFRG